MKNYKAVLLFALSLLAFATVGCADLKDYKAKEEVKNTDETVSIVRPSETNKGAGVFADLNMISSVESNYAMQVPDGSIAEGVLISSSTSKSSAYYSRILDLNQESHVISFEMLAGEAYRTESVTVSLVDALNENNFFTVKYGVSSANDAWTTMSVATVKSGSNYFGYDNYNPHGGVEGYTMYANNFIGQENVNAVHQAFNFYYDMKENAVYTQINAYEKALIVDFDDRSVFNEDNAFKGLTTGQAYVKVTFDKVLKTGGFLATEIGGEKLSGNFNYKKPNDIIKFADIAPNSTLFEGAKGYPYPLPDPITKDFLYGDYEVSVSVNKIGDNTPLVVKDNRFTPEAAGDYQVTYSAKDNFGNDIQRIYPFTINESPTPIVVGFEEMEISIGDTIQLPTISVEGGNGNVNTSVEYYFNDALVEDTTLYVGELGSLVVKAVSADAIGAMKVATNTYEIQAKSILTVDDAFYKGAISGKTLKLPSFVAYDYKNGVELAKKVYVNGTEVDVEKMEYVVQEQRGEILEIVYVGGENTAEEVSKTFYVNVLEADGTNMADYFQYDTTLLSGESNNRNTVFTALKKTESTTIEYPFAVSASFLDLQIDFDENSRFDYVEISLEDYINKTEILMRVYYANSNLVFYLQDEHGDFTQFYLATNYMEIATSFRFIYENERKAILDYKYNVIATVNFDSNGNAFEGFENYGVNISYRLDNVKSGANFQIAKIANQAMRSLDSRGDNVKPIITLFAPFTGGKASFGTTCIVPIARGFDVLSQNPSTVYVSVYDPDFAELVRMQPLNEILEIPFNEYGSYTFSFQTTDDKGNRQSTEIVFDVVDEEAPIIEVQEIKNANVGKSLTFHAPVLSDNLTKTEELEVYILVKLPEAKFDLLKVGESYTFKHAGEHTVIYYVTDKAGNVATYEWVLTVK